jgi:hypothetical protein
MPPLQQTYYDVLMRRVRLDKYPSLQLLDRIEGTLATPEQVAGYVEVLIEKVNESWYPSGQILDRIDHMLQRTAAA